MQRNVKVNVTLTEGYQARFTKACLEILQKRQERLRQTIKLSDKAAG